MRPLLDYLPSIFAGIKEMQIHANAENPEIERLWEQVENAYDDQFLYTMTENGISRWEKMLKIVPMGTDTLEDRRFRVINRVNAQLPYSMRMLEAHLNQMCGVGGYVLNYTPETWTLNVKIGLESKKQFDEILNMIQQMIPMNIILTYGLLYNRYITLEAFTHDHLSGYTYDALRNEVLS